MLLTGKQRYSVNLSVLLILLLTLLVSAGCKKKSDLIPLDLFFEMPDKYYPQLSPNGLYITYLGKNDKSGINLYIKTVGNPGERALTHFETESIRYYFWTRDNQYIVYIADTNSDNIDEIYSISPGTSETRRLFPKEGVEYDHHISAQIYHGSEIEEDVIYVGLNATEASSFDTYSLKISSGEMKMIFKGNPLLLGVKFDHKDNLRAYYQTEDDGGQSFFYRSGGQGRFKKLITWTLDDDFSFPLYFDPDNRHIYLTDSRGRNATAIVKYDPETNTSEEVYSIPDIDLEDISVDPATKKIDAIIAMEGRRRWIPLNDTMKEEIKYLEGIENGELAILSRCKDDRYWVVAYEKDNGPIPFYFYNRKEKTLELLFHHRESMKNYELAEMKAIEFDARDGQNLKGYLTLPNDWQAPGPMVLVATPKSYKATFWGYNAEVQWLANRGYAVLQINTRGTWGRGKKFLNDGNREWAGLRQTDLEDGVKWAIGENIADPERIAIYGGWYGGYCALMGVSKDSSLYAAAVAVSPIPDLYSYLAAYPPMYTRFINNLNQRTGRVPRYESGPNAGKIKDKKDWNEADMKEVQFLKESSPVNYTDKMNKPLLLVYGNNDWLVSQKDMDKYRKMLAMSDADVEYINYPDERIGISTLKNRIDFFTKAEVFLNKHLGGKVSSK